MITPLHDPVAVALCEGADDPHAEIRFDLARSRDSDRLSASLCRHGRAEYPHLRRVRRIVLHVPHPRADVVVDIGAPHQADDLSLIHISEPTRLGMSSYAV